MFVWMDGWRHACMMHACVRACVHACVRACVHACMFVCMYVSTYVTMKKYSFFKSTKNNLHMAELIFRLLPSWECGATFGWNHNRSTALERSVLKYWGRGVWLNDHLSGKELFIRFTASAFRKLLSIYVFMCFPFGFEGRMWDLIVSVPDHCLSFYF